MNETEVFDELLDLEERLKTSEYAEDVDAAADLTQLLHVGHTAGGRGLSGDLLNLLDKHRNLPEYATVLIKDAAEHLTIGKEHRS